MKQILLAIDGEVPTRPVFQYAADLCRRVRAELCILQFTRETRVRQCLISSPGTAEAFGKASLICTADKVLTGVPGALKRMLEQPGCRVPFTVSITAGNLERNLSAYVDTHHDIILTVYDPSQDKTRISRKRLIKSLKDKLGVPLVLVNAPRTNSPDRAALKS